jgi:hypothetical protein
MLILIIKMNVVLTSNARIRLKRIINGKEALTILIRSPGAPKN